MSRPKKVYMIGGIAMTNKEIFDKYKHVNKKHVNYARFILRLGELQKDHLSKADIKSLMGVRTRAYQDEIPLNEKEKLANAEHLTHVHINNPMCQKWG